MAFVERLSVHHEEEPTAAAAGEFKASLEVRLISVIGGENKPHTLGEIPQDLEVAPFKMQPIRVQFALLQAFSCCSR